MDGRRVRFLIGTRIRGRGSRFVRTAEPGIRTTIELPLGQFTPVPPGCRWVFVTTGIGLAPSLPMLTVPENRNDDILISGCHTGEDDLTAPLPDPMPTMLHCVSREDVDSALHGQVTSALEILGFNPVGTDFYLCGSSAMVTDGIALLESRGAGHLFTEPY